VHRLLNPFGFAAGRLAVFQGASTGRASNAEKQPSGRGPGVAMKMGRRLVARRLRPAPLSCYPRDQEYQEYTKWCGMRPPRDLLAAHFERNEAKGFRRRCTSRRRSQVEEERIDSVLPGFKSHFLQAASERLQSLENSRALWLVNFPG
jgi:hypothetical protein